MRRTAITLAAMLIVAGAMLSAQDLPPAAKEIRAEGCVEAGVEAGCLMVKDVATGTLYNIMVKGEKPAVGDGIEFTGMPFDGATICMQGAPVKVTAWSKKASLKCGEGKVHAY